MSNTYTITIETEDSSWKDDEVEIELSEPNPVAKLELVSQAPVGMEELDEHDVGSIPDGIVPWIELVVDEVSSFPKELMPELNEDGLHSLIEGAMFVLAGEEPPEPDSYKYEPEPDEEVPTFDMVLNEDGTVDVDEWR